MITTDTANARTGYLALWRGVPRELGFHILTRPLSVVGFSVTISLFSAGLGTIVTFFIGVILVIASLYVSRGFGTLELVRLEWAGRPTLVRPHWDQPIPGFWGWLRSTLGNGHYRFYLLHTMVALEELRSLSRGFAPPLLLLLLLLLLLDRGLVAALESAADRSVVPVTIVDELGGVTLPQETERNAYFVVSEALANVAKHSGATEATVRVWVEGTLFRAVSLARREFV